MCRPGARVVQEKMLLSNIIFEFSESFTLSPAGKAS